MQIVSYAHQLHPLTANQNNHSSYQHVGVHLEDQYHQTKEVWFDSPEAWHVNERPIPMEHILLP